MEPQLRSSDAGYNFIGTIKNDTKETLEGSFKISSGYWSTEPKFPIKPYDTMDFAAHGVSQIQVETASKIFMLQFA